MSAAVSARASQLSAVCLQPGPRWPTASTAAESRVLVTVAGRARASRDAATGRGGEAKVQSGEGMERLLRRACEVALTIHNSVQNFASSQKNREQIPWSIVLQETAM